VVYKNVRTQECTRKIVKIVKIVKIKNGYSKELKFYNIKNISNQKMKVSKWNKREVIKS